MSRYWSSIVARLKPYTPGEQPRDRKYIKLNTNENPYPPSPAVLDAVKACANPDLRLYPQPECDSLREAIAGSEEVSGLKKENIYISNGSDEMLAFAFLAFFKKEWPVLFPDITYSFYESYCALYDIAFEAIPLDCSFNIKPDDYCMGKRNSGIIFPNPNAPTSKIMPLDGIKAILEANPDSVVIVDEAYIDFVMAQTGDSTNMGRIGKEPGFGSGPGPRTGPATGLIADYPNLLIIRTLSKSKSLAGLRIGYAAGQPHLIEALARIKNSINSYVMDRVALAAAEAAIKDPGYYRSINGKVVKTRERIIHGMRAMGFDVADSAANFIFASHKDASGEYLFNALRDKGILVRHFAKPRILNHLRISIGTDSDMDIMMNCLDLILKEKGRDHGKPACGDKISKIREYYGERRNEGEDHKRLGWESRQAQEGRFETLIGNLELEGRSILDVGCGLGNLYGFLKSRGIKAYYTGVDILAEMTQDAKLKYGDGCFMCLDIFKEGRFKDGEFDIVFTSGIFNIDLGNNREFLKNALKKFFSLTREAVCFNILDPGSPEREKGYFYMSSDEAVKIAMKEGPQGMTVKISANPCSNDYTVICLLNPAASGG